MANMTVRRLHELFDENPDQNVLTWQGACHDCGGDVEVSAVPQEDGIHINGGGVYEPERGTFILKCESCFKKDPSLRNYQPCEVYSRVVGYLRPVAQWNDAKQAEFKDRKVFDASIA